MLETDREHFGKMWQGAWELHGRQVTANMLSIAFAALAHFKIADIERAVTAHIRDPQAGQFPVKPADVIRALHDPSRDGRPDANEAWSMCPRNEYVTVVWTQEMADAWGIAQPLIAEGDITAARMAFREAYERIVMAARKGGHRPQWTVSLGHDRNGRESPVLRAVERGQISADYAQSLLPQFAHPALLAYAAKAIKSFIPQQAAT